MGLGQSQSRWLTSIKNTEVLNQDTQLNLMQSKMAVLRTVQPIKSNNFELIFGGLEQCYTDTHLNISDLLTRSAVSFKQFSINTEYQVVLRPTGGGFIAVTPPKQKTFSIEFDDVLNSVPGLYNSVFGILTDFNTGAHKNYDDLVRLGAAYGISPTQVATAFSRIPYIILNKLDTMGQIIEQTQFVNCKVLNVIQSDLDYYQSGISRVTGLFSYSYLITQAAGVEYSKQEAEVRSEQKSSILTKSNPSNNYDTKNPPEKFPPYEFDLDELDGAEVFVPKVAINIYQARP